MAAIDLAGVLLAFAAGRGLLRWIGWRSVGVLLADVFFLYALPGYLHRHSRFEGRLAMLPPLMLSTQTWTRCKRQRGGYQLAAY